MKTPLLRGLKPTMFLRVTAVGTVINRIDDTSDDRFFVALVATSDLYAIALAWWLFQAGLRSRVIAQVLKGLPRFTSTDSESPAAEVATYLMTEHIGDPYLQLLVIRIPLQRGPKKTKALSVKLEFSPNVAVGSGLESVHVIPISDLMNELTERIKKFRPGWSF